jgi:hypothetical protein
MPPPPCSPPEEPAEPTLSEDYLRGIEDAAKLMQEWSAASKGDMRYAYGIASVAIRGLAQPQIPQFLRPKPYQLRAKGSLPRGRHWPYW